MGGVKGEWELFLFQVIISFISLDVVVIIMLFFKII